MCYSLYDIYVKISPYLWGLGNYVVERNVIYSDVLAHEYAQVKMGNKTINLPAAYFVLTFHIDQTSATFVDKESKISDRMVIVPALADYNICGISGYEKSGVDYSTPFTSNVYGSGHPIWDFLPNRPFIWQFNGLQNIARIVITYYDENGNKLLEEDIEPTQSTFQYTSKFDISQYLNLKTITIEVDRKDTTKPAYGTINLAYMTKQYITLNIPYPI